MPPQTGSIRLKNSRMPEYWTISAVCTNSMDEHMHSTQAGTQTATDYLIASKRCEAQDLEHFLALGELVTTISDLVHNLQRERGASNLYLASSGVRFVRERQQLCCATDAAINTFYDCLQQVENSIHRVHGGMRLFNRIAFVLHTLKDLGSLREQIVARNVVLEQATQLYNNLIQSLLAIVFETADAAVDPIISASLVAMFNFMQGKELAGQERAAGASGFARGYFDDAHIEHINHLIEGQHRCLEVFSSFAGAECGQKWTQHQQHIPLADIDQLRVQMTQKRAGDSRPGVNGHVGIQADPELANRWFLLTTTRIDAMKEVEEDLAQHLRELCETRLRAAQERLAHHESLIKVLEQESELPLLSPMRLSPMQQGQDKAGTTGIQHQALAELTDGRSLMELLQFQAQRLQQMSEELNAAKTALEERKLIERAKLLLMKHRSLSEEQAHRLLRQMAMNQSRRLAEIARSVIEMADVWR